MYITRTDYRKVPFRHFGPVIRPVYFDDRMKLLSWHSFSILD